jgi:RimJ/RimL family protein N-acetyltransferase
MLKIIRSMSDVNVEQLLDVYLQSNREIGKCNFPNDNTNLQLLKAQDMFISFLREDFFCQKSAFYALWEREGHYVAALRVEPYCDGVIIAGLETALSARECGYASALLTEVVNYLQSMGCRKAYSHILKNNKVSLHIHSKCGFQLILEYARLLDGTVTQRYCTMCCCLK